MPLIGAHMSIVGGYHKAVEAAALEHMDVAQLFTKNNNQWKAKPITDDDARRFRETLAATGVGHPLSHSSYLINLASGDIELRRKSIHATVIELERAERLGIGHVVLHPGAYKAGTQAAGIKRIVSSINQIHRRTAKLAANILLETTAGQGTSIGHTFEQLAAIIEEVKKPDRLGVCFDTCHVFAAGYPLSPKKDYLATMRNFDRVIGLGRIKAFHLNDSKKPRGSRVDRHEHIGLGHLGDEPFRLLLNDRRFRKIPMCLETSKGEHEGRTWDAINLARLRRLTR